LPPQMRSCRPVHALAGSARAVIGAGGNVLQWSFANAAGVPAIGSRIGADDDGAANEEDAGADTGDAADEEAGPDGDRETTPEESVALRPWMDPLPHPTTTTPSTTEQTAARRAAFMVSPRSARTFAALPGR